MADYCTPAQVYGNPSLEGYLKRIETAEEKALIAELITRSSRRIDDYVTRRRETDYFAPAGAATAKTIYGEGLSFLKLPTHVPGSVTTVTVPTGYTVPLFVQRDGRLQYVTSTTTGRISRLCGVWLDGLPYSVTAKWGTQFDAVPGAIVEACLQLVIRTYRSKDEAFSGIIGSVNSDNQIIERALPAAVKQDLDIYRAEYKARNLGFC